MYFDECILFGCNISKIKGLLIKGVFKQRSAFVDPSIIKCH